MSDVNNLQLADEIVNYNPTAELNPSSKIPDGWYLMEVSAKSEPIMKAIGQQPCVEVNVQGKIVAPGEKIDGFRTSGYVNSYIFQRGDSGGVSLLHALLKAAGMPAPPSSTLGQLQQLTAQTLGGTPQVRARIRLEASTRNSEGGTPSYLHLRGMKNFPDDNVAVFTLADGTTVTKEGREQFVDFKPTAAGASATN